LRESLHRGVHFKKFLQLAIVFFLTHSPMAQAEGEGSNGKMFYTLFQDFCLMNAANYEALRSRLLGEKYPMLEPEVARQFLRDDERGDIWPIKEPGLPSFLLILHSTKKSCSIRAQKLDGGSAGMLFQKALSMLPSTYKSETLYVDDNSKFRTEQVRSSAFTLALPNVKELGLIHVTASMVDPGNTLIDASITFPDLDGNPEDMKRIKKEKLRK
jgi:hypothetical protein